MNVFFFFFFQLDSLYAAKETFEKRLNEKASPLEAFSDAVKVIISLLFRNKVTRSNRRKIF